MNDWIAERSFFELFVVCLGICASLTAIGLTNGYALERFYWKRGRKVFDVPSKPNQLRHEILGTALFHVLFVPAFAATLSLGWLRFSEGWLAELLGFFVPWYAFQIGYYGLHRAMHSRALFWMHRWHHESLVSSPMTGFSMHPAEAGGWVVLMLGPPIALAQFGLLGFGGFAFFLAMHWIGNIVGHANAELIPIPSSKISTVISSNPISYHALHHARFDGHYGFAAATMDRLMGTEFSDWLAVHRRVFAGQPLESLRQKLD